MKYAGLTGAAIVVPALLGAQTASPPPSPPLSPPPLRLEVGVDVVSLTAVAVNCLETEPASNTVSGVFAIPCSRSAEP